MTLIFLLSQNSSSVSILLKKKQYASVASLLRIIIESFFSMNWVTETNDKNEINDRIYKLEGNSSYLYELELEKMEENLNSENPVWKSEAIKLIRDAVEKEKKDYPFLTEIKNGKIVFKTAPSIAKRMTNNRIKYYHLYSFTSFFSHPTPRLKILFLGKDKNDLDASFFEPLATTMIQCLQFIIGILGNAVIIFKEFEDDDKRTKLLNKIKQVTLAAIKYYKEEYKREPI